LNWRLYFGSGQPSRRPADPSSAAQSHGRGPVHVSWWRGP